MTHRENRHRARLDAADHELSVLAAQVADADMRLQAARQRADEAAVAEAAKLAAELTGRYRQLEIDAAALAAALAQWRQNRLHPRAAEDDPTLLDGSLPIALLPVRIETRF